MARRITIRERSLGAHRAYALTGFGERLRGLLGSGDARRAPMVLIERCHSVHTFGMGFAIDICFIDGDGMALSCPRDVGPGRIVSCVGASAVIERAAQQGPWIAVGSKVVLERDRGEGNCDDEGICDGKTGGGT